MSRMRMTLLTAGRVILALATLMIFACVLCYAEIPGLHDVFVGPSWNPSRTLWTAVGVLVVIVGLGVAARKFSLSWDQLVEQVKRVFGRN